MFFTTSDDFICTKRNPRFSPFKPLDGRPEFLGNAVELRFTLPQQPQTCLHHLFVALIFAALKLLGHNLFRGAVFKDDMSSKEL